MKCGRKVTPVSNAGTAVAVGNDDPAAFEGLRFHAALAAFRSGADTRRDRPAPIDGMPIGIKDALETKSEEDE